MGWFGPIVVRADGGDVTVADFTYFASCMSIYGSGGFEAAWKSGQSDNLRFFRPRLFDAINSRFA